MAAVTLSVAIRYLDTGGSNIADGWTYAIHVLGDGARVPDNGIVGVTVTLPGAFGLGPSAGPK